MPYNVNIQNTAGQSIGQGISNAGRNALSIWGWLQGEADATKELRSQIKTAFPELAETSKGMNKSEMAGLLKGKQWQQSQLAQNINMLQGIQGLQEGITKDQQQAAMGSALRQAVPVTTERAPLFPGGGNTFGVDVTANDPSKMTLGGVIGAMSQFPGSEQSPAGLTFLREWAQQQGQLQPGGSQGHAMLPFSVGGLSGILEARTGKAFLDVDTTRKLSEARRAPPGSTPPAAGKGRQGRAGLSLFDQGGEGGGQKDWSSYQSKADVIKAYNEGRGDLSREEALEILRKKFFLK